MLFAIASSETQRIALLVALFRCQFVTFPRVVCALSIYPFFIEKPALSASFNIVGISIVHPVHRSGVIQRLSSVRRVPVLRVEAVSALGSV